MEMHTCILNNCYAGVFKPSLNEFRFIQGNKCKMNTFLSMVSCYACLILVL